MLATEVAFFFSPAIQMSEQALNIEVQLLAASQCLLVACLVVRTDVPTTESGTEF